MFIRCPFEDEIVLQSIKVGTIDVIVCDYVSNQKKFIRLNNFLYVLERGINLISVVALDQNYLKAKFGFGKCTVFENRFKSQLEVLR